MYKHFRSYVSAALLIAAALANVQTLKAQTDSAPPKWSVVTFTTVKPEMKMEYEAWQKQLAAAYKKAEVPSRVVLETVMGDLFEYVSVVPLAKFAVMDGPTPVERALGKDQAATLMRKGRGYITSVHRITTMAMDDLSIRTESEPEPYAIVTISHLLPAKVAEFASWMKDEYLPAMKKAEVKNFWVSQTVFGGNLLERVTVRPIKSLGEIDGGPVLVKAVGAEEARKLNARRATFIQSSELRIVKVRPDLSYSLNPPQKRASVR
jgi:hypothetical protein